MADGTAYMRGQIAALDPSIKMGDGIIVARRCSDKGAIQAEHIIHCTSALDRSLHPVTGRMIADAIAKGDDSYKRFAAFPPV